MAAKSEESLTPSEEPQLLCCLVVAGGYNDTDILKLGLTKCSLRQETATFLMREAGTWAGSPYGSPSMNPRAWAVAGLLSRQ